MIIKDLPLKDLIPFERNAKKHDEKQIKNVMESIKQFGFAQPLVVDKDNVVIIGHCRLIAAKRLKLKTVPTLCMEDLNEDQVAKLRLLDNKLNESEWDFDFLAEDIPELDFSDFDIDWELPNDVIEDIQEVVEDEIPDTPQEAKSKVGQLWKLGNHRLICGDSTDENVVKRLMDGEKARMLFTSPPYSDMREYNGNKDLSVNNIVNFISTYRPYTDYQCINLGIQRKNHDIVQYWDEYIAKAKECGYKFLAWNVWDKTMAGSIGQQSAFFPIRHEWIFVFGTEFYEINETWEKKEGSINRKGNKRKVRQQDGTTKYSTIGDTSNKYKQMESVVSICSETGEIRAKHPATFPIALPSEYIKAMTDENDSVIEPFGGSGTTLMACEQLKRKCYICELDPKYVDVIIERWENFTGNKAELVSEL